MILAALLLLLTLLRLLALAATLIALVGLVVPDSASRCRTSFAMARHVPSDPTNSRTLQAAFGLRRSAAHERTKGHG